MNPIKSAQHLIMRYWYWHVRMLNAAWPSITVEDKKLVILPGVYKPLENEHACADYVRPGERVLDLGCGSGVNAIFCAEKAREVVAVDISGQAVKNARENVARLGIDNIEVKKSDMFSNVEGRFDVIVANPPYIATDFDDEEEQFATSTRYLPALFASAHEHLTENGRLLIQFPMWHKRRIAKLAARHAMRITEIRRLPLKSPGLFLLSLAYLQVGFRSTFYLLEPLKIAGEKPVGEGKPAIRLVA